MDARHACHNTRSACASNGLPPIRVMVTVRRRTPSELPQHSGFRCPFTTCPFPLGSQAPVLTTPLLHWERTWSMDDERDGAIQIIQGLIWPPIPYACIFDEPEHEDLLPGRCQPRSPAEESAPQSGVSISPHLSPVHHTGDSTGRSPTKGRGSRTLQCMVPAGYHSHEGVSMVGVRPLMPTLDGAR